MSTKPSRFEALKNAVKAAGTQLAFAEALGISQSAVSQMLSQTKQLPGEYVLRVERLYGVPCHHLRPDLYPPERFQGIDQARHQRFFGLDHAA